MSDKAWQASQHQEPADPVHQLAGVEDSSSEGHARNATWGAHTHVDQGIEADETAVGQTLATRLAEAAAPGPLIRQVFISHTGPQQHAAGSTFAACMLKPALEAAGLNVFMDFSSLEPGCTWPQEVVRAAANSAVVVVVLTKEYTQRYWCMLELSLALHSRKLAAKQQQQQQQQDGQQLQQPLIIPVFYDNPDQVVCFNDILNHWQGPGLQHAPANRQDWVDPSGWAANICAMDKKLQAIRHTALEIVKDRDYQLARCVVAAAVKAMPVQCHPDPVYGFDQLEADLTAELVVPDPDRLGLWLHGMGGSGKTTLATMLFNRLTPHFQHSAFIQLQHDERVGSQQLISVLTQLGATGCIEGSPPGVLLKKLQDYVSGKAVLIVVDNVWVKGHLDDLLPRSFGQGSRVIITSRLKSLPDSRWWQQVNRRLSVCAAAGLADEAAKQLLYASANMDPHFQPESEQLHAAVKELIDACNGLPLALQLTGASVYCNDSNEPQPVDKWQEALAALQCGRSAVDSEDRLKGILYSTFATLERAQQHMFLDVATALRGQSKQLALAVWVGWHGRDAGSLFEGLERRNLVSSGTEELQMHDVLAAVAHGMLLEEGNMLLQMFRGTRLWLQDRELKGYSKGTAVLTAQLGIGESWRYMAWNTLHKSPDISGLQSSDLSRAKILLMANAQLPTDVTKIAQLDDLLWLQSTVSVDFERLPFTKLTALRILQLEHCSQLVALPHTFCQLTALQRLKLGGCSQLATLPTAFGNLAALRILQVEGCSQLLALPATFSQLTALQVLQLRWCNLLARLPADFGNLTSLTHLEIIYGQQLEALPESIERLKALTYLRLRPCSKLAALPASFGELKALTALDLSDCSKLAALPESFEQLKALTSLWLMGCSELAALPQSIGQLTALQRLNLCGCRELASLPESFTQLNALRHLNIERCWELTESLDTRKWLLAMPHWEVKVDTEEDRAFMQILAQA